MNMMGSITLKIILQNCYLHDTMISIHGSFIGKNSSRKNPTGHAERKTHSATIVCIAVRSDTL
jgi:hypothetical protein